VDIIYFSTKRNDCWHSLLTKARTGCQKKRVPGRISLDSMAWSSEESTSCKMASRSSPCYRVNRPKVVYEVFEDETVLINLDSGSYYSFSGSGALIWDCIIRGDSVGSVIENLQERFCGMDGIGPAVEDFMRELVQENLVVEASSRADKNVKQEKKESARLAQFERPVLQKYSDMQDLLLLDPIHEVDETGWPSARLPNPSGKQVE
jgi:hypothetical protein